MRFFSVFAAALLLSSCASTGVKVESDDTAPLSLTQATYSDLSGWNEDDHAQALVALSKSCKRFLKQDAEKSAGLGMKTGDWQGLCRDLGKPSHATSAQAKNFFETHFTPWKASAAGAGDTGLFTGYYEASLSGSRTRGGKYQHPLRGKPGDLVMVELGDFSEELKGKRIAGRVKNGTLKPYEDRAAIEAGKLPDDQDRVLFWVDDPVDVFFLQIQGSGRVALPDGSSVRVGYDGQNGHAYYAIGRELIKRGHLTKEQVSMDSIRAWLEAHPDQADELMNLNKSYVFMKEQNEEGPIGGENVALTPGRSLAIDRAKVPYGIPVWLDAGAPVEGHPPLKRLMVAQDTGGAIKGAVRGDVFFGYGSAAEALAGPMKSQGRYWFLLPKGIIPEAYAK